MANVYTGLHIAAGGLTLGSLDKTIINQPSVSQPVKRAFFSEDLTERT